MHRYWVRACDGAVGYNIILCYYFYYFGAPVSHLFRFTYPAPAAREVRTFILSACTRTHTNNSYSVIYVDARAHATHKYENTLTQTHAHGLIRIDQCNCRQLYIVAGYLYTRTPDIIVDIYVVNIHIYIYV